ncbi:alpha/beta fold hydrolase [Streptomyces sp. NPDC004629]|uniref:alpha/beta fold hydrolase n=1 Tax=Streptomyces sp. NPDC004629 TaxID=3364705 RepID=UPI003691A61F
MTADPPSGRRIGIRGVGLRVTGLGTGGTPTVLLHGGGPGCSAWTDFAAVAGPLAERRRLILVDLPQYGDSDSPDITGPLFTFHAAHLAGLLDALGIARADFVCQSLGGSVALRLAADRPDRVGRLVVTGSQPIPLPEPHRYDVSLAARAREEYYGNGGPSPDKMRALMTGLEWYGPAGPAAKTVALRYAHSTTRRALELGTDPARRGTPEDLADALAQVAAPVLLLWGAHDPFCGPDYALTLAQRLSRADVFVLGRTSHHPQEERPADYARAVDAFLPDGRDHPPSSHP